MLAELSGAFGAFGVESLDFVRGFFPVRNEADRWILLDASAVFIVGVVFVHAVGPSELRLFLLLFASEKPMHAEVFDVSFEERFVVCQELYEISVVEHFDLR